MDKPQPRWPLTGIVTIEWVDGADPDDSSAPPNFGWLRAANDRPMEASRLATLLREIAATLDDEEDESDA
jgi:hypothetical protein